MLVIRELTMLDKNNVYDRRIIHDFPKMPAIMMSAFNFSNIIYRVGTVISLILMVACALIVITLLYQMAFIPDDPIITEPPMRLTMLIIGLAIVTRWVIPFLFSALVRTWYYMTRSKWQK